MRRVIVGLPAALLVGCAPITANVRENEKPGGYGEASGSEYDEEFQRGRKASERMRFACTRRHPGMDVT